MSEPIVNYGAVTFRDICNRMVETHIRKQGDYGDSYAGLIREFGDVAAVIPLQNKLDRIKNIIRNGGETNNESLADSVLGLACYAVMYLVELNKRSGFDEI